MTDVTASTPPTKDSPINPLTPRANPTGIPTIRKKNKTTNVSVIITAIIPPLQ
jgi:hypothetical protein